MKSIVSGLFVVACIAISAPVMAQAVQGKMQNASTDIGVGLIKKVDKTKGAVTLAHGAMNGMPAMTMVYKVRDASGLDMLKAGDKIRFATDPTDGGMTLSHYELTN